MLFTLILTVQQAGQAETFLLFSRRWCYSTSFGVLNATRFHFPHLPERQRHCHCCHHSNPSTLQGPLWGVESPRRLPPFPLPPNLSLSYWVTAVFPPQVGLTSTDSLFLMSAEFCTLQITFSLMAASGRGRLMTSLGPQPPLRS